MHNGKVQTDLPAAFADRSLYHDRQRHSRNVTKLMDFPLSREAYHTRPPTWTL
jgi:hypothetical protein